MISTLRRKLLSGLGLARLLAARKKRTEGELSAAPHGGESPEARALTASLQSDIDKQEEMNRDNKELLKELLSTANNIEEHVWGHRGR